MSSMKAFLSPSYFVLAGPERCLDASTLSFFREERQRAKTASPVEREVRGGRERKWEREGRREGEERAAKEDDDEMSSKDHHIFLNWSAS